VFGPTRYISWALEFYGKVPYDLASSGIPLVKWSELGLPAPEIDDPAAFQTLTKAIARYNDVSPEEVTPALGTSNAIFLAYAAMLSPGDEILVEQPGYEPLTRAAEGLGATVRTFTRRLEDGFRVVPERVAAAIGPRTRAIVVTSLHNPTGVRVDDATIRELADIAGARGAYVLVDEVYAPFDDLPESGVFRRSARKLAKNVVAISSLTKCYGLGMHRVGWVLGPEELSERARAASIATFGHLPLSYASYGVAAFGAIGQLAKRARALLAGKRELAARWVATLPNAHWSAPSDGLYGLVTLPGRGDILPRIEARAREAGVLVGAGTFFGAPESFRLSWASCDAARFTEGLHLLEPLAKV
jgi:aspartate/methionine/tyrosine aminotransferase